MFRIIGITLILSALLTSGAFTARVPAQQQAPAQAELLAEVRLLRQAIETLAGTNARVQIVFGRLQMQEQRTENAAKRLDATRLQIKAINERIAGVTGHIKAIETAIAEGRRKAEELEREGIDLRADRNGLERMEAERAQLLQEEQDAANLLNQEQNRWSDLNRQLDELEKLLTKSR
jgi:hypothetical protein